MRRTSALAAVVLAALSSAMVACDDATDLDEGKWLASLRSAAEIPEPVGFPTATGTADVTLDGGIMTVVVRINGNLTSAVTMAHIHGPASSSETADIVLDLVPLMSSAIVAGTTTGTIVSVQFDLNTQPVSPTGILRVDPVTLVNMLNAGDAYMNVHTVVNPTGELRGQLLPF